MTTLTKLDEVWAEVLPMLERNGVADTELHRLWALEGLLDGWLEEPDEPGKQAYVNVVRIEIARLTFVLTAAGVDLDGVEE